MNWGNRILVVFIAFAGFIGYIVYSSMHTKIDLVAEDYYKDELAYQDVIDGRSNAEALKGKTSVSLRDDSIVLQLPEEMNGKKLEGKVLFYSPVDVKRDLQINLQTNNTSQQTIDKKQLQSGNYTVKITWQASGKKYYSEQQLIIQ